MTFPVSKFTDIVQDKSGGNQKLPQELFLTKGDYPVVDQGKKFIAGYIKDKDYLVKSTDLPVIVFGDHTKAIKFIDFPFAMGADGVKVLKPKAECDTKYLYHYLRYAKIPDAGYSRHYKFLKELEIPLPSLSEQRRIASILDKADELRQKRQQAIEKLDQLLQATFIDMFGDPITNPKGWEVFKSKALFQDPPRIGTTTPANGEGIPVVRVGELGQFSISFDKCGKVQISETDFKKFELKLGDLVLARAIGSKNQLGKCSYFSGYSEPVCIDSHVMRLRPDSKKMHPLWFYFLLSSDQGKKILQSKGGATAVQFNINSAQANDLDIALPSFSEQTKFVEIANKMLKNKESYIKALEANTLLFSALQNQAFSGNL